MVWDIGHFWQLNSHFQQHIGHFHHFIGQTRPSSYTCRSLADFSAWACRMQVMKTLPHDAAHLGFVHILSRLQSPAPRDISHFAVVAEVRHPRKPPYACRRLAGFSAFQLSRLQSPAPRDISHFAVVAEVRHPRKPPYACRRLAGFSAFLYYHLIQEN